MADVQVGPGDVVTLHSGGYAMTVCWITGEGDQAFAHVCWHTSAGELRDTDLPLRVLRKASREGDGGSRLGGYTRPPRTGYRDERGTYHPAPGSAGFAEHAGRCLSCAREVGCAPDGNGKLRPSGLTGSDLPIEMPVAPLRAGKR